MLHLLPAQNVVSVDAHSRVSGRRVCIGSGGGKDKLNCRTLFREECILRGSDRQTNHYVLSSRTRRWLFRPKIVMRRALPAMLIGNLGGTAERSSLVEGSPTKSRSTDFSTRCFGITPVSKCLVTVRDGLFMPNVWEMTDRGLLFWRTLTEACFHAHQQRSSGQLASLHCLEGARCASPCVKNHFYS